MKHSANLACVSCSGMHATSKYNDEAMQIAKDYFLMWFTTMVMLHKCQDLSPDSNSHPRGHYLIASE